jgi:ribosomal protein S27AE
MGRLQSPGELPTVFYTILEVSVMGKTCGKCGGTMAMGVVVDHSHGKSYPEQWQKGEANVSWLWGLRLDNKALLNVQTWRCNRCGFLESYAPDAS